MKEILKELIELLLKKGVVRKLDVQQLLDKIEEK